MAEDTKRYKIVLVGVDVDTEFEMELTNAELELVQKMAELSQKVSLYEGMPILEVSAVKQGRK